MEPVMIVPGIAMVKGDFRSENSRVLAARVGTDIALGLR